MISETLRRVCLPWAWRQAPAPAAATFDARREQARLAEGALRLAARIVAQAGDAPDSRGLQAQVLCEGVVATSAHLRLGWAWFGSADTDLIEPQIVAGPAAAYAQGLQVRRSRLTEHGPAFRALGGRQVEPFNVNAWSLYPPWRDAAREHGVRSVLALPLLAPNDARRGLFVLYADMPDYFDAVGTPLFESLAELVGAVLSQCTRAQQLQRLAHTDTLTGLHNRAAAMAALQHRPAGQPLALLLLDLDHFKRVNDGHGHAAGDAVLVSCAQRLQAQLRRHDGVARWGGEEFLVWLPASGHDDAAAVAEKLRAAIAAPAHALPGGGTLPLTLSVGGAVLAPGEALEQAIARADRALYRSKDEGRNRVTLA